MPAFLFALIATLLAATGGRDQRLMAQLSARLGATGPLLFAGLVASAATAGIAALAGQWLAVLLPPAGKTMLIALALALGAAELAWPMRLRDPAEPTRSLFAITLVIASRQLGDAARFLIVAFAAASGTPVLAGIGGALGGGAALVIGWALGAALSARVPLRAIRLGIAGLMLFAAVWAAISARGLI